MVTQDVTTRTRILASATTLFSRYGFKRTTMEDIATGANLSRASLYLQFRNKEDIFRALASDLQEQSLAAAAQALAQEGPLADRLLRAVEAKSLRMLEIAHGSPHGSELMDESHRLCGDVATAAEARFASMLGSAFTAADQSGEVRLAAASVTADEAADLFLNSVTGLKRPGIELDAFRGKLAVFVRVYVAGLGAGPKADARSPAKSPPRSPRT